MLPLALLFWIPVLTRPRPPESNDSVLFLTRRNTNATSLSALTFLFAGLIVGSMSPGARWCPAVSLWHHEVARYTIASYSVLPCPVPSMSRNALFCCDTASRTAPDTSRCLLLAPLSEARTLPRWPKAATPKRSISSRVLCSHVSGELGLRKFLDSAGHTFCLPQRMTEFNGPS